jgi:hypothetical protein
VDGVESMVRVSAHVLCHCHSDFSRYERIYFSINSIKCQYTGVGSKLCFNSIYKLRFKQLIPRKK